MVDLIMEDADGQVDDWSSPRPPRSFDEVKASLGSEFLTPPTSFSAKWLDRLQHRWDEQIDHTEITQLAPTQSRTVTRFTREGLEGRVTGYKEVTVPASSATAKNSTSILRRPADRADFVRGAAGFFPFAPGGLDGVDAIQAYEDQMKVETEATPQKRSEGLNRIIQFSSGDSLLEVPPGFSRGMRIADIKNEDSAVTAKDVEDELETQTDLPDMAGNGAISGERSSSGTHAPDEDEDETYLDDLNDLLPIEFPSLEPHGQLLASNSSNRGREWAHIVDVNKDIPNFHELVPDMAKTWLFELDTFQKEAVYHLENGDSVFVAAHTSAGKTVVAEYAIALAARHLTKAIYTSPIKALSNQKFRDFKTVFDDVGILTGDVQINAEASCLIMTTEILRSMLYRGADLIRDVEFVIFDEVHYVSDAERGVVWEEVIIMLPDHVNIVLLSATVPNTLEFASWVGRTKKKNIYVISTAKRPVPLEHYLWSGKEMHKIVDSNKKFLEKGWKEANDIMSGRDKIKEQTANGTAQGGTAGSRGTLPVRGGRGGQQIQQRGGGNQRGGPQQRGQPSSRGQGNIARTGRGGGRTSTAQDRNVWVHLVHFLRKENLLPTCIFVFSKKRCEENAASLSNQDFCTAAEKSQIHMIVEKSIARLKPDDRLIPQIRQIKEKLSRGIAVHHGGLLPIIKEIVEILFARTLVKVLFATETFAMGLNLPTRTVAFSGYRKHDGKEFRNLTPGEYTQMAGRAGRRGIDTVGTVIIVSSGKNEAPSVAELRAMIIAPPTKLKSQFRLHYNMILNLMRVEALKIEEMIKRSFSENATQALLPQHEKEISGSQARLEKIKRESCPICDVDIDGFHDAAIQYQRLTQEIHETTIATPVGRRLWTAKRLIVYKRDQIRTVGVLMEDGIRAGSLKVLELGDVERKVHSSDVVPYLPDLKFRRFFTALPTDIDNIKMRVVSVSIEDIECVTQTVFKLKGPSWSIKLPKFQKQVEDDFVRTFSSWSFDAWEEVDWSKDTSMRVRDLLSERQQLLPIFLHAECLDCPDFLRHFEMQHAEYLVKTQIQNIMHQMSDQNLALLPDHNQRVEVLKELGFIDPESRVLLKGKVACEIHSADELILTELILENTLAEFEPSEIVALLSSFVFQEKSEIDPYTKVNSSLQRGIDAIIAMSKRVNNVQILHQVVLSSDDADFENQPRFGLVEVVYNWAEGMGFKEIMDLTDVMEGTIVRVVTRLDETCREVMSAARLIGDPGLYAKMEKAREMIRRDVVFTASLYM